MGYFEDLRPEVVEERRLRTWERWEGTVHQLLAEINEQVFDGACKLRERNFDGYRMGLELLGGSLLDPVRIRVGVRRPAILEVSAEGPGCVEMDWGVYLARSGRRGFFAIRRLREALRDAISYLELTFASVVSPIAWD